MPLEELLADVNAAMVEEGAIPAAEAYIFGSAPAPQKKKKAQGFVIPDAKPAAPTGPAIPSAPVQIEGLGEVAVAPAPAPAPAAAPAPAGVAAALSPAKEAIIVAGIIAEMRPTFLRDGGDVELVDMEGSLVLVNLTGACSGCQIASLTLGGIAKTCTEALGRPIRVMPVAKT